MTVIRPLRTEADPMPSATRREFLQTAAGALAAATAAPAVAQTKDAALTDDAIPIIDTHQHLWDLTKLQLPWLGGKPGEGLNRSHVTADYLREAAGLNVVKTVYMEVDVAPEQHVQEAEHVLALCADPENPMAGAVIGGRPNEPEFKDYILRFAKNPHLKGVRQVLHGNTPRGLCLERQFVESMKILTALRLRFDLCMRPGELLDAVKLVDRARNVKFVIDHCGNMPVQSEDETLRAVWMKGMRELALRENTVCKISGIIATAKKDAWKPADLAPNVNFCLDTFGEDRVMFASDWPVCTVTASLREWVTALQEIVRDRPPQFRRKLFHDNAAQFYGLRDR
jgi:L-fuconolactonase